MADYIDREALLNRIEELQNVFGLGKTEHENGFYMGLNRALAEVDNFPAADVVPWEWLERYAHGRGMQYASGFVDEARKAWEETDEKD